MVGSMSGSMDGALVFHECSESVMPVVPVCEELDLGYQISQGGSQSRFYRDGSTVQVLHKEGRLFTVPVDSGHEEVWHECDQGMGLDWGHGAAGDQVMVAGCDTTHEVAMSCQGYEGSAVEGYAYGCTCLYVGLSGKALREHLIGGHRPHSDKCPWCVRANLRERRATRKLRDSKADPNGWVVDSDYSGKHNPDINGHVQAYVGVEVESGYGYVRPQDDRSSAETLIAIKQLECELKQVSGDLSGRIAHHHHDDDKSFRGVVAEHGVEQGWKDTDTGGYRPNANSVVERRIGMARST